VVCGFLTPAIGKHRRDMRAAAYAELKQASKLSDRAISETLKTNIAKLRTEEFAKAITSLTGTAATRAPNPDLALPG
jgi:hypothetical protein